MVLLIAPILWPIIFVKLFETNWLMFKNRNLHEKAWDFVFSKDQTFWVIATMSDGERVGGFYSGESYATGFPNEEQIFLQEEWNISPEGKFLSKINQTDGVLLNGRGMKKLELYKYIPTPEGGTE
jgi:hypothetical protein